MPAWSPSRSRRRSSRSPRTPAWKAASSSSGCKNLSGSEGLNAATGDYEDLVKIGVIDAAKVTRSALQNAASIAALFLTTEAVVADKPEKDAAAHARWRHGGLLSRLAAVRDEGRSCEDRPSSRPDVTGLVPREAGRITPGVISRARLPFA